MEFRCPSAPRPGGLEVFIEAEAARKWGTKRLCWEEQPEQRWETFMENVGLAMQLPGGRAVGEENGGFVCTALNLTTGAPPGSTGLPACIPPPRAFQKLSLLLAEARLCGWGARPQGPRRLSIPGLWVWSPGFKAMPWGA